MCDFTQFRTLQTLAPLLRVRMTPLPPHNALRVRLGVLELRQDGFQSSWRALSRHHAQDVCFLTLFTFCRLNSGVIPSALPGCCLVNSTRDSGEPPLSWMLGNQA